MRINDLYNESEISSQEEISFLHKQCSEFFEQSKGKPLYKVLPTNYNNIHKVKVRQHKKDSQLSEMFDKAFNVNNLRERAIFAYPYKLDVTESTDLFYVFPINGFKFVYCKEVKNSDENYKILIDTLFENESLGLDPFELTTNLLKFTYLKNNLFEGLNSESEIVFYGIPYYYAVRSSFIKYNNIIGE